MADSSAQFRMSIATPYLEVDTRDKGERSTAVSRMSRLDDYEKKAVHISTTTASVTQPPATAPSRVDFNPEDDFEYESKGVSPDTYATEADLLKQRYKIICKSLGVVPVSQVMKQIGNSSIVLRNTNLNSKELKAVITCLVMDTELAQLDITGNTFGEQEAEYICELLETNRFLTHLVLAENHLTGAALEMLIPVLVNSKSLRSLDLSGNGLCDKDSKALCSLIEDNECISELILHHNQLGQCGAALGQVLANNDTITSLDLSWNHIRGAGAVGLAKGIGKNSRLTHVNFSWNGFGFEGCVALAQALKANSTLHLLDLINNRIHPPALLQLMNGVCANKTLSSLLLGLNPIPAHLTTYILTRIDKWKHGNLKELDLQGLVVDKEFSRILSDIQAKRLLIVRYDTSLPLHTRKNSRVDPQNIYNIDPMRILFFMKQHLRTIDLFLKIDQNNDGLLSREEMKYAFELEGYPISDKALDQVMGYLDVNKSGEVDLGEFFSGERRMRRDKIKERQENEERLNQMKGQDSDFSPALIQSVSPAYSQAYKKPSTRLPKLPK